MIERLGRPEEVVNDEADLMIPDDADVVAAMAEVQAATSTRSQRDTGRCWKVTASPPPAASSPRMSGRNGVIAATSAVRTPM